MTTNLPEAFRIFLISQKFSHSTVKNYLADLNHFLAWLANKTAVRYQSVGSAILQLVSRQTIEDYKNFLVAGDVPSTTINRRLSALRKLCQLAKTQNWLKANPMDDIANIGIIDANASPAEQILEEFKKHLEKGQASDLTIKNYLSDLRHFLGWIEAAS